MGKVETQITKEQLSTSKNIGEHDNRRREHDDIQSHKVLEPLLVDENKEEDTLESYQRRDTEEDNDMKNNI